jgi:hypothetical protein
MKTRYTITPYEEIQRMTDDELRAHLQKLREKRRTAWSEGFREGAWSVLAIGPCWRTPELPKEFSRLDREQVSARKLSLEEEQRAAAERIHADSQRIFARLGAIINSMAKEAGLNYEYQEKTKRQK